MTPASGNVVVFPHWADNPYLNLLYLAPRAAGRTIHGPTIMPSLEVALRRVGSGDVLHLHWTAPICQRAETLEEAWARLEEFRRMADDALGRGAKLVWTIHNRLPHECAHLEPELELSRYLVEKAAAIHVMMRSTSAVTADIYELPEDKVVYVPHSSYQGVYDHSLTRAEARARLGIADDEKVVLFFGQMRPYKGLDLLLEALESAAARAPKLTLLMAGKTRPEDLEAIEAQIPDGIRVIREHSFIPDDEAQQWFVPADVAVFPYANVLNSGSAHLAATFGVPVILPRLAHFVEHFVAEQWVRFYDPLDAVASLTDQIVGFEDADRALSRAASEFSVANSPFSMSRGIERMFQSILD